LLGPGGITASAFFGLKTLTGIEVFRFADKPLQPSVPPPLPAGWEHRCLSSPADLARLPPATLSRIAEQSGASPGDLVARGASIHVLLCDGAVVSQLNIERAGRYQMDDPRIVVHMAAGDGFLGYLYTWPDYRRRMAAQLLVAHAEPVMRRQGIQRLLTHVRATNVPSIAAFRKIGCRFSALVFADRRGRPRGSVGIRSLGLAVGPAAAQAAEPGEPA
jgi:ribosomal protein S18 acetylase RimI-like enzyme